MKNEFEHIDQMFRQKFESFEAEPPQNVWDNISHALDKFHGGAGFKTFLYSVFGFVLLGTAVFLLKPFDKSNSFASSGSTSSDFDKQIAYEPNISNQNPDNKENTSIAIKPNQEQENINKTETEKSSIVYTSEKARKEEVKQPERTTNNSSLSTIEKKPDNRIAKVTDGQREISQVQNISETRVRGSYYVPIRKAGDWKIGLSANPEITLYPDDTISNSRNYNIDFSLGYHRNNFFVQSGLGLAIARDEGSYKVDYESYDFIGEYDDLLNISFDSTENGVVPIYETKKVEVFDSIRHIKLSKTTNTYTYLQIPLLIGYQKQFNRLGFYIKGGPNLSLLMSKHIPGAQLPDDIKIIDMEERITERIKTNWQLMFGAGVNYQLTDRWEVALEPTFRYYLNAAYDNKQLNTKHPYAFGIRAGVYLKLK